MVYPIWACDALPISNGRRVKLAQLLHDIAHERKDFQYNSPVQDIIDPDIYPYVFEHSGPIFLVE